MPRKRKAADLFCGAGGTSIGAKQTGTVDVVLAINHWDRAIDTHEANFAGTKHINSRIEDVSPSECEKLDLLFASPECTHHSNARGGRPTSDQQRAGAWDILPWMEHHRPRDLIVENVPEFRSWGPVGDDGRPIPERKGEFFDNWVQAIRDLGYNVDHQILNAADFGAATSRRRIFVVARKGRRQPRFPEPTHAKGGANGLMPWRPAYEIVDWDLPCPSIFNRKRPLADKTLLRIEAGLRRFVSPFTVTLRNHSAPGGPDSPLGSITAGGTHHGMAVPFQYQLIGLGAGRSKDAQEPLPTQVASRENHGIAVPIVVQYDNHGGQGDYVRAAGEPLYTFVTKSNQGIAIPMMMANQSGGVNKGLDEPSPALATKGGVMMSVPYVLPRQGFYDHQALKRCRGSEEPLPSLIASHVPGGVCVPVVVNVNHGDAGHKHGRTENPIDPLGTFTAKNGRGMAMPFLCQNYSNGSQWSAGDSPVPTITTKDRHSLTVAVIAPHCLNWPTPQSEAMAKLQSTMKELGIIDIGFRMFQNHELAAAQGFPSEYVFCGKKAEVTKQIGNSVSPPVARKLTEASA